MAEIRIKNLHKRFADFTAVRDSSLLLEDGKFIVLLGPSGCGKTTTLRMIAGLEYPTSGQILLDGEDVTFLRPRQRDIAMVFQLFALYPHMGVRANLEFPLRNEGLSRTEIDRRIRDVAGILRIEHLLGQRIGGLAGGDRQRVALGRAIVRQPKAFLMDEPLGTLDAEFREVMCVELRKLHDRLKTTTVFVTHDQNEAMSLADTIVVMNKGEILQADDTDGIYNFPSCLFVAGFIGRPAMNLLPLAFGVTDGDGTARFQDAEVAIPTMRASASHAVLGVRPEHIDLLPAGQGVPARINYCEYFGSHWVADLESPLGTLKAVAPKDQRPVQGEAVGLRLHTERLVLFDRKTELLMASDSTLQHQPGMRHG
ncbi:ABC transporter ATP-binding protein [Rubrivivax sp. RP6-9]|uniref:ABC transporter ATP-binding protein n=1 Tax=Rubrivivax sp. RP6-9 TaxID=3415750 RepID=UPI003CC57C61